MFYRQPTKGPGLFYGNIWSLAERFGRGKIGVVTNMDGKWTMNGDVFRTQKFTYVVVSKMFGIFILKIGEKIDEHIFSDVLKPPTPWI